MKKLSVVLPKTKKHLILLALIILTGAFFRLYLFPYRYSLGEETVRDAVIGIEGARELQLPLTGSFSSLGPFTFGPWYAYQIAFFYLLFPVSYSPWIYLSLLSILYIFISYKMGELLENKTFGLLLAALAAFSPALIISATHLTSHNNTNIFVILTLYFFLYILKSKVSRWYGFFLGISLGIGMNLHYQMSGLLILPFLFLFSGKKKYILTCLVGVFITFIPLLLFELNNNWFNVRNFTYYYLYDKHKYAVPYRWLFYVRDFWPGFWSDVLGIPVWLGILTILSSAVIFGKLIFQKKISKVYVFLIIAFICNFIALRYYWGNRFYGYLNFLRPFIFILTGYVFFYFLREKKWKVLSLFLFITLLISTISQSSRLLIKDPFSQTMYANVNKIIEIYPRKRFYLYGCTKYYSGSYNAVMFSTLYILDLQKKIKKNGIKLALSTPHCPISPDASQKPVADTGFWDFSSMSDNELKNTGFEPVTFESIYDQSAMWWLKK